MFGLRKTVRHVCWRCKYVVSERSYWKWDSWYKYFKESEYYKSEEKNNVLIVEDFCLACIHKRDPRWCVECNSMVAGFPGEAWRIGYGGECKHH